MEGFSGDPVENGDRAIKLNTVERDVGHVLACEIGRGLLERIAVPVELVRFAGPRPVQFEDQVLNNTRAGC